MNYILVPMGPQLQWGLSGTALITIFQCMTLEGWTDATWQGGSPGCFGAPQKAWRCARRCLEMFNPIFDGDGSTSFF